MPVMEKTKYSEMRHLLESLKPDISQILQHGSREAACKVEQVLDRVKALVKDVSNETLQVGKSLDPIPPTADGSQSKPSSSHTHPANHTEIPVAMPIPSSSSHSCPAPQVPRTVATASRPPGFEVQVGASGYAKDLKSGNWRPGSVVAIEGNTVSFRLSNTGEIETMPKDPSFIKIVDRSGRVMATPASTSSPNPPHATATPIPAAASTSSTAASTKYKVGERIICTSSNGTDVVGVVHAVLQDLVQIMFDLPPAGARVYSFPHNASFLRPYTAQSAPAARPIPQPPHPGLHNVPTAVPLAQQLPPQTSTSASSSINPSNLKRKHSTVDVPTATVQPLSQSRPTSAVPTAARVTPDQSRPSHSSPSPNVPSQSDREIEGEHTIRKNTVRSLLTQLFEYHQKNKLPFDRKQAMNSLAVFEAQLSTLNPLIRDYLAVAGRPETFHDLLEFVRHSRGTVVLQLTEKVQSQVISAKSEWNAQTLPVVVGLFEEQLFRSKSWEGSTYSSVVDDAKVLTALLDFIRTRSGDSSGQVS